MKTRQENLRSIFLAWAAVADRAQQKEQDVRVAIRNTFPDASTKDVDEFMVFFLGS